MSVNQKQQFQKKVKDAKEKMVSYIETHNQASFSELSENFDIPPQYFVVAFKELAEEGTLKEVTERVVRVVELEELRDKLQKALDKKGEGSFYKKGEGCFCLKCMREKEEECLDEDHFLLWEQDYEDRSISSAIGLLDHLIHKAEEKRE